MPLLHRCSKNSVQASITTKTQRMTAPSNKPQDLRVESAPPKAERFSQFRWVMIGFAFFATTINYLDRQVLSVVAASADFKAAVPVSEEAYGYVASAFMLAYAIMNGLSGPFIDSVGTRMGYACCM